MEFLISSSKQSNFIPITTIHNANSTEIPERKSKVNGGVLVEKYLYLVTVLYLLVTS